MVQLDYQLVYSALLFITGANAHRMKELISAYEQAVDMHNTHQPEHEIYRIQSELRLRNYIHRYQDEVIRRETDAAIQLAIEAQARFDSIIE